MLIVVILVVSLCSLVGDYQHFRRMLSPFQDRTDDRGDTFLQNVGKHLQDYMATLSRRSRSTKY
jgi:hypothetical protein